MTQRSDALRTCSYVLKHSDSEFAGSGVVWTLTGESERALPGLMQK